MKSLSLSQPHVIVMVGVPGSGKTFFAEKFADMFHAPYVSREKIAGLIEPDTKPAVDIVQYQLSELLKTKQPIIIEGVGDTRAERSELARAARSAGYETLLVWVQTDPVTSKSRAVKTGKNKTNRTLTTEEFDRAAKRFTPPNALEKPVVISGKHTYATQAKAVLKRLSGPRAQISTHNASPVRLEPSGRRNITIR